MFDILEKYLDNEVARAADILQFRGQRRTITVCKVRNGVTEDFSSIALNGVGIRAHTRGKSWGFSSTNNLKPEGLTQALTNAIKLAKASSRRSKTEIPLVRAERRDLKYPVRKPASNYSAEETAQIPLQACKGARENHPEVVNAEATYIGIEDDRYFLSSEGSRIHQEVTRILLMVDVVARTGDTICPASEMLGHSGGMELFDRSSPYSLGQITGQKAVRLLKSKAPPSGRFQVVVHPTLCATLLHEAIGHSLEADIAMTGGGFGDHISDVVSSTLVTIYDYGKVGNGLGYFAFDDEGVECKKTNLIEKGVLRSFMHDRTSAALAGVAPTGNAYAWDYSVEPLIRQTNIGIEGGDFSIEEMIEGIKDGLFLEGTFGGEEDVNANFTFGFQGANRISNGKLTEDLRGANVAGNAIEVFKTIDAVGRESILRPGLCGKYQFAVQGRVVPAIRCKIVVGGGGNGT